LDNKFSLVNVQSPESAYEAQSTGNFNCNQSLFNPIYAQKEADTLEINKNKGIENNRLESFKNESLYKKSCFFCSRNKDNFIKKQSFSNENKINNFGKIVEENMTEKLKVLMKSFNIERRFSDKLDKNRDLSDNKQNEEFKESLTEINSYDFNNYYPKDLSFILLDLRISVDKNEKFYDYKAGFLPMTIIVEQEELIDDHVIKFLIL
jgi:hypothetical protein